MTEAGRTRVTLCVCTFRRAHLGETLRSLAALDRPTSLAVDLVVADNDEAPSAAAVVESFKASAPFAVTYVHAPARNISIARNACLEAATGRYCAFIDDDEVAAPGWLGALFAGMEATGARAVLGPVDAVYGAGAPGWMRRGAFHATRPVVVGGEIRTGYTCNVLIDRAEPAIRALRFDPRWGRSGGEDTDFFARLHAAGGAIAYAPDATLTEPVPETRARFGWLAARRFRMGQTHGHLIGAGRAPPVRVGQGLVAGAKAAACFLMAAASIPSPVAFRRQALRGTLHVGAVCGLAGMAGIAQYGAAETSAVRPERPHAA